MTPGRLRLHEDVQAIAGENLGTARPDGLRARGSEKCFDGCFVHGAVNDSDISGAGAILHPAEHLNFRAAAETSVAAARCCQRQPGRRAKGKGRSAALSYWSVGPKNRLPSDQAADVVDSGVPVAAAATAGAAAFVVVRERRVLTGAFGWAVLVATFLAAFAAAPFAGPSARSAAADVSIHKSYVAGMRALRPVGMSMRSCKDLRTRCHPS